MLSERKLFKVRIYYIGFKVFIQLLKGFFFLFKKRVIFKVQTLIKHQFWTFVACNPMRLFKTSNH